MISALSIAFVVNSILLVESVSRRSDEYKLSVELAKQSSIEKEIQNCIEAGGIPEQYSEYAECNYK